MKVQAQQMACPHCGATLTFDPTEKQTPGHGWQCVVCYKIFLHRQADRPDPNIFYGTDTNASSEADSDIEKPNDSKLDDIDTDTDTELDKAREQAFRLMHNHWGAHRAQKYALDNNWDLDKILKKIGGYRVSLG